MHVHYLFTLSIPSLSLSVSLSLSMARGMLLPAELMALVVILVLVHQTCSAEGSHHCPPSSCGTIRNISYPFRLEGDPEHCGDPRYTLSCENDQTVELICWKIQRTSNQLQQQHNPSCRSRYSK